MLTKLIIRNFKRFEGVEIDLGNPTIFVGPNNSGKTTALQGLSLWDAGVRQVRSSSLAMFGTKSLPVGISTAVNRTSLHAIPVPTTQALWPGMKVPKLEDRALEDPMGFTRYPMTVEVEYSDEQRARALTMEFAYANDESIACKLKSVSGSIEALSVPIPRMIFVPPLSGLSEKEFYRSPGEISFLLGLGRPGEVLRNLCWRLLEGTNGGAEQVTDGQAAWDWVCDRLELLFGVRFNDPETVADEMRLSYSEARTPGVHYDISSAGRGVLQALLLFTMLKSFPGAVLLIDEPDVHLEVLLHQAVYRALVEAAKGLGSQVILTTHSEALLSASMEVDACVVSFVGMPHAVTDKGKQLIKALRDFGHEQYFLAEQRGWVLYCEGETDLLALQAFASHLQHGAKSHLESPFFRAVGNARNKAEEHFYGIREGKHDLRGFALLDQPGGEQTPSSGPLQVVYWKRREIENYFVSPDTLLRWAEADGAARQGDLFTANTRELMAGSITGIEDALRRLQKPGAWDPKTKVSDDVLPLVFGEYFSALGLPNRMNKSDYHELIAFMSPEEVDPEVIETLNAILKIAEAGNPTE